MPNYPKPANQQNSMQILGTGIQIQPKTFFGMEIF